MRRLELWKSLCGAGVLAVSMGAAAAGPETVTHGRFEQVPVLQPAGEPQRMVIWFGGIGDGARRQAQAEALRADGAMVAMVDTAHLYRVLDKDGGDCAFSSGDVENFSRYVQAFYHVPTYRLPLLVGDGEGSALVYAVAAQAPANVLAGVLTDGLRPASVPPKAICGDGVGKAGALKATRLPVPWLAASSQGKQGDAVPVPDFINGIPQARLLKRSASGDLLPGLRAAIRSLGAQKGVSLPPPPADLEGLPIVEVPSAADGQGDTFAVFVSGDGGWAGLDKEVAGALAQAGIPVVGVDSLRYFWQERTPQGFADDLDRIVRFYAQRWKRSRVVLIGFSQGADVLPAAINHLPPATLAQMRMAALLSIGKFADYEFHVSNWISSGDDDGLPIAPEMARLPVQRTVCIYGVDDDDALCPSLPKQSRRVGLPGDHHFEGDYETLAKTILQQLHDTAP
ncbi:virulence factor [[Pseudomonas] boreopolis]|uniref:virulence factor n=1 Tax=Xanthomonas boreopolis TaxID=86183 RepID=UPI003DA190B0